MALQNTDEYYTSLNSTGYRVQGSNLNTVNGSAEIMVNRGTSSNRLALDNVETTLQDTDQLLVNRGGQSYSVTGALVKEEYFPTGPAGGTTAITDVEYFTPIQKQSTLTFRDDTNLATFVDGDSVKMVDVNGNDASYTPTSSTITNVVAGANAGTYVLSFATDQDLKFFKTSDAVINSGVGPDMVQANVSYDVGGSGGDQNKQFFAPEDKPNPPKVGTIYKYGGIGYRSHLEVTYNSPFPAASAPGKIVLSAYNDTGTTGSMPATIRGKKPDDSDGSVVVNIPNGGSNSANYQEVPVPDLVTITEYIQSPVFDTRFAGFYIDNVWITLGPIDIEIVSVDVANKKVIVYGGNWQGSDGSAVGNSAQGYSTTLVYDGVKHGTGKYKEHTGNVAIIKASNNEWISNDNALSENFYITSGTAELALDKALLVTDYGPMLSNALTFSSQTINGIGPLYRIQLLANAQGNGTSTTHVINGITYYKPNT